MNKEIAMKWADALESGRYMQGKRALRKGDSHCCLGVLCEISGKGFWAVDGAYSCSTFDRSTAVLPNSVLLWADMYRPAGDFIDPTNKKSQCLALMNDRGVSFAKIAKYIRKYYDKL